MTSTQTGPRYLSEWGTFDLAVLSSLYRHRLLTTTQIHDLHKPDCQRRWVQKKLRRLEIGGYITRVTGPPPGREARWFCTALGYELAESSGDVKIRSFRMTADKAVSAPKHLLAVNDVGIALTKTARRSEDEFGCASWQHEIAHPYGHGKDVLISDAVLTYDAVRPDGVTAERRFIELDRGTEIVHTLVNKMVAYNDYFFWEPKKTDATAHLPRRAWKRKYVAFPGVVFVFAGLTANQAKRRTKNFAGFLANDPRFTSDVAAIAITVETLKDQGPFAPTGIDLITGDSVPLFA